MGDESPKLVSTPPRAVFLSYASQDAEAAQRICDSLRAAGIEVWFDRSELRGGDVWDRRIREQIQRCRLFIPVISRNTQARDEGYFRREWALAAERTRDMAETRAFLLPVVIDATDERDASVPEKFTQIQWTRLPEGATPQGFVAHVAALLGAPPAVPAAGGPPAGRSGASPARRPARRTLALLFGCAALALGSAAGWLWLQHPGPGRHPQALAASRPALLAAGKSIAVMPFLDMSANHDQQYFADGMAEDLIDLLTRIPQLRVIARTSSFSLKGSTDDLRVIGARLGADYVVEGGVRQSGGRIRVTAQLSDARSGTQIWSSSYDRDAGDVLTLQGQIATALARALQIAVGADGVRWSQGAVSPEAYRYYLSGRAVIDRGDESVVEAKTDFLQALALDPGFFKAAEALALAYLEEVSGRTGVANDVAWPAAAAAARRALQLEPRSALSHAILGLERATYAYDWAAATAELEAALALQPRDSYALYNAAWLAFDLGRHDEAMQLQQTALALDPLNPDSHQNDAYIRYLTGDLDGAEREFRRSLEISPTFGSSHRMLGEICLQRHQFEAALVQMEAESADDVGRALVYFALGRRQDSDRAALRAERNVARYGEVNVALIRAYRGERDQAFAWLDRAVTARDINLGHRLRYDPIFRPLQADPRFRTLLRRMNLLQ